MANNNTGGCAGGILQIFGGIGMLLLTCARMGDDVVGCASAASKFDDIGRTGSRVYYPAENIPLSQTYTRYADEVYSGSAIDDVSSIPSSLVKTGDAIPTVTAQRPITAKAGDYVYNPLRAVKLANNIAKVIENTTEDEEVEESVEAKIVRMHKRLLQRFCDDYLLRNVHFNKKDKGIIVKAVEKAGSPNFLFIKDALIQIDNNILDLEQTFPNSQGYATAYKRAVLDNFMQYLNISNSRTFDFSTLCLARRDSGFAVFLELTGDDKERDRIVKNMFQAY
jgi:hypothetical protein